MDAKQTLESAKQCGERGDWELAYKIYAELLTCNNPSYKLQGLMGQQVALDAGYSPYSGMAYFAVLVLCISLVLAAGMGIWGISIANAPGATWRLAWPVISQGLYALLGGLLSFFVLRYGAMGLKNPLEVRIATRTSMLFTARTLSNQSSTTR